MSKIKHLDKYGLSGNKKYGFIAGIFLIIDVTIGMYIPYISADIIDVHLPKNDINLIWFYSAILLSLSLIGLISLLLTSFFAQKASQNATLRLRNNLYKKIQRLSHKSIDELSKGKLITSVTNDVNQLRNYYGLRYTMILRAPLYILGGVIFALLKSPDLSIIYAFIIPTIIIVMLLVGKRLFPLQRKRQKLLDQINTLSIDNVNAPRVFKSFVSEKNENEKFSKLNNEYKKVVVKSVTTMHLFQPISSLILNFGTVALIILGAILIEQNVILPNAGIFIAFNIYSAKILVGVIMIAFLFMNVSRASISATRIKEIFEKDEDKLNEESDNIIKDFKSLEFKNISFRYNNKSKFVIENINLKINAGQKIGIIGSTGSGKSSFVKLIPRLYDAEVGEILINGINITNVNTQSLREIISMSTQEAVLFKGTIKSNILQGKKDATEEELNKAIELSCIKTIIEEKEGGLEHLVDERGVNLSGGQKQRISLARALIRNPKLMILDDVTSALDAKSEKIVKNNLNNLKDITLLLISQKISSIKDLDKIIVLDNNGMMCGFDSHSELLRTSKVYQELYNSQYENRGDSNA